MKLLELNNLLQNLGISPSKKLGQNFLIDENLLDFIAKTANIAADQNILEVGPGLGSLTERMLSAGAGVTAIEFDHKLYAYLKGKYSERPNFELLHQDACKTDFQSLGIYKTKYKIISNLPYSISTPFIAKVIELENLPYEMTLLLQKESALRFAAKHDTKDYGSISVRVQLLYDISLVRLIPPPVFYPVPEVHSALVSFKLKKSIPDAVACGKVKLLTKTAFLKRRKKMINTIRSLFSRNLEEIFTELNINVNARPEDLTPEEFLKLSSYCG